MSKLKALDPLLDDKINDSLYSDTAIINKVYNLITEKIDPPYSISINGTWGSGKTTFVKLLETKLEVNKYPHLWFNPWEYERSSDVVLAFLKQLSQKFMDKADLKELGIFGLSLFVTGIDAAAQVLTGGKLSFKNIQDITKNVDASLKERYEKYDDVVLGIKEDFAVLTQKISGKFDNKTVFIFFDDLDRCLPENAINLLEALKNLFVVKDANVIFISGIDTSVAKQFIKKRYEGIKDDFAINYFKKIFNLTFDVPEIDKNVFDKFINSYIKNVFRNEGILSAETEYPKEIKDAVILCINTAGIKSLRQMINIINSFFLIRQIGYEKKDYDLIFGILTLKEVWVEIYENLVLNARKNENEWFNALISNSVKEDIFKGDMLFLGFKTLLISIVRKKLDNDIININADFLLELNKYL